MLSFGCGYICFAGTRLFDWLERLVFCTSQLIGREDRLYDLRWVISLFGSVFR